jgi:hypothetical protein
MALIKRISTGFRPCKINLLGSFSGNPSAHTHLLFSNPYTGCLWLKESNLKVFSKHTKLSICQLQNTCPLIFKYTGLHTLSDLPLLSLLMFPGPRNLLVIGPFPLLRPASGINYPLTFVTRITSTPLDAF